MEFTNEQIEGYNKIRDIVHRRFTCNAPWRSMYFGIANTVTMCCYNQSEKLGLYKPGVKLLDIWHSDKAKKLRRQFSTNTMAEGCVRCAHQIKGGNYEGLLSLKYDSNITPIPYDTNPRIWQKLKELTGRNIYEPDFPEVLEFEIANTCNLECVMCNEACSSSISIRNGKLPVLGQYDDDFIVQLRDFIPHLRSAHFFGGEPFLIESYYKIWEMIIEINPKVVSHISSNGTILNARARKILESHSVNLSLSLDAITQSVYEKIRINANYERVMDNIDYLVSIKDRMDHLSITACAMPVNSYDLPNLVEFCNQKKIGVFFNTVFDPKEHSMLSMSAEELKKLYEYYESISFAADAPAKNVERFKGLVLQTRYWYQKKSGQTD